MKTILSKEYDGESIVDIERDVYEALDGADLGPSVDGLVGTFKVAIVWTDEEDIMIDVKAFQESYDWREAFDVSGVECCLGAGYVSKDHISVTDVKNVIAADEGYNDGDSWVAIVETKDGRFAYVEAWCDYTGWDCQSGGRIWVSDTLDNLLQVGLTNVGRDRLKLETL